MRPDSSRRAWWIGIVLLATAACPSGGADDDRSTTDGETTGDGAGEWGGDADGGDRADVGEPEEGVAGEGDGAAPDETAGDEGTGADDADAGPPALAGRLTLHGGPIPPGMRSWAIVFDGPPSHHLPGPRATVVAEADGTYAVPLSEGDYWVFGLIDADGDLVPTMAQPPLRDLLGVHPANPVHVPGAPADVDIRAAQGVLGSYFMEHGTFLYVVGARALDPTTGASLTDAAVTLDDGVGGPVSLVYNAEWLAYAYPGWLPALPATYTFTVSHPTSYDPPETFAIGHRPLTERPEITEPADDATFASGSPVAVAWTPPIPDTERASLALYHPSRDGGSPPVWRSDDATSPATIPASAFPEPGDYQIELIRERWVLGTGTGFSIEAAMELVPIHVAP
jgi:hypothetical protein